jgi:hypothetical protein
VTTELPDHLERLGRDLARAWPEHDGRRSRVPWRARLVVAVLVLAAALGLVLVRGDHGPGSIDRALAAVGQQPVDTIVHWTSTDYAPDGALADRQEIWGATSAPYGQRSIVQDGPSLPPVEQSSQGDAVTQYDPAGNVLFVRSLPGGAQEGNRATRIGANPERVTNLLRAANTRDEGVVEVGGRPVRRFLITPPTGGSCTYDVDPDTYYGLAFGCEQGPNGHGVETWEYLPRTPASSELLSVAAQHPSARVDRAPMQTCSRPDQYEIPSMPPCYVNAPGG